MPFVKIDCAILNSTIWIDREAREIFLTALLMAEPRELTEPTPTFEIGGHGKADFEVPPGWYGFVPAAAPAIVMRAGVAIDPGMAALKRLASPEADSRTPDFEGRRLVRIDGGFIVLNFDKYRTKDYGAAQRMARHRERMKKLQAEREALRRNVPALHRNVTQAEAEAEAEGTKKENSSLTLGRTIADIDRQFETFWTLYPRKVGKRKATQAFYRIPGPKIPHVLDAVSKFAKAWKDAPYERTRFIPHPATWLGQGRFDDDPAEWAKQAAPEPSNGKPLVPQIGKSTLPPTSPKPLRIPGPDAPLDVLAAWAKKALREAAETDENAPKAEPWLAAEWYGPNSRSNERVRLLEWMEGDDEAFERNRERR